MLDQILVSQSDKISIDIYYNGALSEATNVTVRELRDPNGIIIANNLVTTEGSTTGRYECAISSSYTVTLGVCTAIWRFTIDSTVFEHTQQFEVVSALRAGYVLPIEVQNVSTYSEITDLTDEELQKYIDKCTQVIDSYVGGSLLYSQYIDKVRCVLDKPNSGLLIPLKHRPIISVTSVSLMTRPTSTVTLDVDYLRIRERLGHIEYFYSIETPYSICSTDFSGSSIIPVATVSYTAGYATIPDDLKNAAVLIVEGLVKEANGDDTFMNRMTIGDVTEGYSQRSATERARASIGEASWITVKKILSKYRQPGESPGLAGIVG